MKKWLSFILLLVLFFLAIPYAGISSVEYNVHSDSAEQVSIARHAIERFGLRAFYVNTNQPVSQNLNSFPYTTNSELATHAPAIFSAFFLPVEMFGNTLLNYNYPSHHFW